MKYRLTVYHSPDSDDAFMFYALTKGILSDVEMEIDLQLKDIQSLNEMAMRNEVDVSAVSFHTYAYIYKNYHILPCGASFGDGYGPRIISLENYSLRDLKGKKVAIPGRFTTATLAFRMLQLGAEEIEVPFNEVGQAMREGRADAGILIHEGQITHQREGFFLVKDLGEWWKEKTGMPLPLGGNIIRKDLPPYVIEKFPLLMRESVEYSLKNKSEALKFAKDFGRGISESEAESFVSMYVNHWTVDYGEKGKEAVKIFLDLAFDMNLIPEKPQISFL
ncbi:MAG: menaquinone biosynthesis family protein [Acidobacteriota bacterium]